MSTVRPVQQVYNTQPRVDVNVSLMEKAHKIQKETTADLLDKTLAHLDSVPVPVYTSLLDVYA